MHSPFRAFTLQRPAALRRRKKTWRALHSHVCTRHRQTPVEEHDEKTRHADYRVAQPSYSALQLEIGDFCTSVIRCCVRTAGVGCVSAAPRSGTRHFCSALLSLGLSTSPWVVDTHEGRICVSLRGFGLGLSASARWLGLSLPSRCQRSHNGSRRRKRGMRLTLMKQRLFNALDSRDYIKSQNLRQIPTKPQIFPLFFCTLLQILVIAHCNLNTIVLKYIPEIRQRSLTWLHLHCKFA